MSKRYAIFLGGEFHRWFYDYAINPRRCCWGRITDVAEYVATLNEIGTLSGKIYTYREVN